MKSKHEKVKKPFYKKWWFWLIVVIVIVGAVGGITSSGSSIIVQLLAKTPLGMVGSCFVVQFIMDYIDRVICLYVVAVLISTPPNNRLEM